MKIVYNMKRVILLSSIHAVARPAQFYNLAKILRPDIVPSFYEWGYRYADPRQSPEGIDFSNCGNTTELKQLLEKRMYTSHRRRHIYADLPQTMIQKWEVTADVQLVVKIQHMLKTFIQPWEDQNPIKDHRGFFYEMFFNHFSQEKLEKD